MLSRFFRDAMWNKQLFSVVANDTFGNSYIPAAIIPHLSCSSPEIDDPMDSDFEEPKVARAKRRGRPPASEQVTRVTFSALQYHVMILSEWDVHYRTDTVALHTVHFLCGVDVADQSSQSTAVRSCAASFESLLSQVVLEAIHPPQPASFFLNSPSCTFIPIILLSVTTLYWIILLLVWSTLFFVTPQSTHLSQRPRFHHIHLLMRFLHCHLHVQVSIRCHHWY